MMTDKALNRFLTNEQIANLPDQRGVRSWPFEPYLELQSVGVNLVMTTLLHEMRDSWLQCFNRKPNAKRQENFVNCLRVFLLNLMRVYVHDVGLTVGIPSQKERLGNQVQYRPAFMSVDYYRRSLKLLVDCGLVDVVKRGHRQQNYGETSRYALSDKALKYLPLDDLKPDDFRIGKRDEVILLKDSMHRLIRYEHTQETQPMRDNLCKLNNLLGQTDIATSRPADAAVDYDDDFSGQRTDLYRVFNNSSFAQGGRFYGGWWMHAKKHFRRKILINNEPTVEIDYKGLHPAILFAKYGIAIPSDPYALIPGVCDNPELRNSAKTTFLALMNAGKRGTSEPKDFDMESCGMSAKQFREAVKGSFPMLPGIFHSGQGLFLQREDSDLAEKVLLHFANKAVPVLPVHDSFIIAERHREELAHVMQMVFDNTYGQMPTVTIN